MSAGWLYYHKHPPRRKCPECGLRHYLVRQGSMSNGADVWALFCTKTKKFVGRMASDWPEGGLL